MVFSPVSTGQSSLRAKLNICKNELYVKKKRHWWTRQTIAGSQLPVAHKGQTIGSRHLATLFLPPSAFAWVFCFNPQSEFRNPQSIGGLAFWPRFW
jgi:hypothetical protein